MRKVLDKECILAELTALDLPTEFSADVPALPRGVSGLLIYD